MSRLKKILFVLVLLLSVSCSKEDDTVTAPYTPFTASIDGIPWSASTYRAGIYQGTITVIGTSSDGSEFSINLSGDTVGSYDLNNKTSSSATYRTSSSTGKGFSTGTNSTSGGQAVISDINRSDQTISGSFSFTGVRSSDTAIVEVTSGIFIDIPYVKTPIGSDNNSMSMKLGANNWTPSDVSGFVAFERLLISGFDGDGTRNFQFELPYQIGPGKYEVNYFTNYKAQFDNTAGLRHYAVSGTLEIESHNLVSRKIVGKFDIKMEAHEGNGSVHITEGAFDVIYE